MRIALFASVCLVLAACSSEQSDPVDSGEGEDDLKSKTTITSGSFAMLAGEPGRQLDPIGCRHYMRLALTSKPAAAATFEAALDAADPGFMDGDGCGGESFPTPTGLTYKLTQVSKDPCGGRVFEGTVKWTSSGRVTRTLRIHDNRKGTCDKVDARIVLEEFRALDGASHLVETYYSVD